MTSGHWVRLFKLLERAPAMRTRFAYVGIPVVLVASWAEGCGQTTDDEPPHGHQQAAAAQTPLDPTTIPKFAHELPIPRVFAPTLITSGGRVIRREQTISIAQ